MAATVTVSEPSCAVTPVGAGCSPLPPLESAMPAPVLEWMELARIAFPVDPPPFTAIPAPPLSETVFPEMVRLLTPTGAFGFG